MHTLHPRSPHSRHLIESAAQVPVSPASDQDTHPMPRQMIHHAVTDIHHASPSAVLYLQRTIGNRAVASMIQRTPARPTPIIQRRTIDYLDGERINTASKTRKELDKLMERAIQSNRRDIARLITDAIDAGDYQGAKAEAKQRASMRKQLAKEPAEKRTLTSFRSKKQNRALLEAFTPGTEFQPKEDQEDFDPRKNYIPSFPGVYEVRSKSFIARPSGFTRTTEEFRAENHSLEEDNRGTIQPIKAIRDRNVPRNGGHWLMNSRMKSLVDVKKTVPFTIYLRQRDLQNNKDKSDLGKEIYLEVQFVSGYDIYHDENIIKYSRDIVTAIHKATGYPITVSFETMKESTFEAEARARKPVPKLKESIPELEDIPELEEEPMPEPKKITLPPTKSASSSSAPTKSGKSGKMGWFRRLFSRFF